MPTPDDYTIAYLGVLVGNLVPQTVTLARTLVTFGSAGVYYVVDANSDTYKFIPWSQIIAITSDDEFGANLPA